VCIHQRLQAVCFGTACHVLCKGCCPSPAQVGAELVVAHGYDTHTHTHTRVSIDRLLQVPYSDMTPLQAAVGVVQKGLRPGIPPGCPPALADVLVASWQQLPSARPSFADLTPRLQVGVGVRACVGDMARDEPASTYVRTYVRCSHLACSLSMA
jgi:hypothetical protein